jgi:hypothetical protein
MKLTAGWFEPNAYDSTSRLTSFAVSMNGSILYDDFDCAAKAKIMLKSFHIFAVA